MCMHWQHKSAAKIYEEFKVKPKDEIEIRLNQEIYNLAKATQDAIDYHGSLEKITHGFFSGNIFASRLNIEALEKCRDGKPLYDETFPKEPVLTIFRG